MRWAGTYIAVVDVLVGVPMIIGVGGGVSCSSSSSDGSFLSLKRAP